MEPRDSRADADFRAFCATRDPAALGRVFDATAARLLAAAVHLSRDPATAEDLVQTTFLQAIESAESFDRSGRVLPWLLGILTHRARDHHRARERRDRLHRERATSAPSDSLHATAPPEALMTAEQRAELEAAINRLQPGQREAVNLRYAHGLTPTEIAHALDRPVATVKSQLARGLRGLRATLPPAIASSLALLATAERGLAAVRARVLNAVPAPAGWAASSLTAAGVLMKKSALAAIVAVLTLGAWWVFEGGAPPATASPSAAGGPAAEAAPPVGASARTNPSATGENLQAVAGRRPVQGDAVEGDAQAATGSVRLRIRWTSGQPAAGFAARILPRGSHAAAYRAHRIVVDADGEGFQPGLPAGEYVVRCGSDCSAGVTLRPGQLSEVTLELRAEVQLDGIVLDALGRPLADAEVCYVDDSAALLNVLTVSKPDGGFAARIWGGRHTLVARLAGYGRSEVQLLRTAPGEHHDVVFQLADGAASFRGTVVGPDGEPVAGADVCIDVPAPRLSNVVHLEDRAGMDRHSVTGSDGTFAFENVGPGDVALAVFAREHAPHRSTVVHDVDGQRTHSVRLASAAELRGVILDPDGQPVAGARVAALGDPVSWGLPVTTSSQEGEFTLRPLPAGRVRVHVSHPRWGSKSMRAGTDEGALEVRFERGGRIFGCVLGADGAPVDGWSVEAFGESGGEWQGARTDAAGRFAMDGCTEASYTLHVSQPVGGRKLGVLTRRRVEPRETAVELRVAAVELASAWIRGRVLRPLGYDNARIEVRAADPERRRWASAAVHITDGAFELGPLPPGDYAVEVRPASPGLGAIDLGTHSLAPDAVLDLDPVAAPTAADLALDVRVRGGGAAQPLSVVLEPLAGQGHIQAGTWFRGWCQRPPTVAPGRYVVQIAGGPCHLPQRHEVEVFEGLRTTLPIDLVPAQPVSFRLVAGAGVELPEWSSFAVESAGGPISLEKLVFFGDARVQGFPVGEFTLRYIGPEPIRAEHRLVIASVGSSLRHESIRLEAVR